FVPLVALVERDRRIDDLVRELVERRVHLEVGGHTIHRLEEFLALAREQELGEEQRRVRPARIPGEADRARLAEGGLQRLPLDGSALLLQRLHIVVIGVDEERDLARSNQLRAEDVSAANARLHRGKALEVREAALLAHRLRERREPKDVGRLDGEAPVPSWIEQILVG